MVSQGGARGWAPAQAAVTTLQENHFQVHTLSGPRLTPVQVPVPSNSNSLTHATLGECPDREPMNYLVVRQTCDRCPGSDEWNLTVPRCVRQAHL